MPVTPLHYLPAYLIKTYRETFNLPALVVGSVAPDLFLIIDYAASRTMGRIISHSLLGTATVDTFLSVALTVFLYPSLVSFVFRLDKEKIREKCCLSVLLVASCLIGCVLHVLIDSLHHKFNPPSVSLYHGIL